MSNREHIEQTAIRMAEADGLISLSRRALCDAAGIPDGSFPHVMGCTFNELVEDLRARGVGVGSIAPSHKSRAQPSVRRDHILSVAVDLSRRNGYKNVTRDEVAAGAGVSTGLVSKYFGTMVNLHRDIMRAAIRDEVVEVIAQGLASGDKHAKKAPDRLKLKAAAFITA